MYDLIVLCLMMPTVPLRQRLLNSALRYAQKLQILRREEQESDTSEGHTLSGGSSDESDNSYLYSDSDLSSPSTPSFSVASLSSLDSEADEDHMPTSAADDTDGKLSSDEEIDCNYLCRLAAVRSHIKYLTETRVLEPNHVHKLSQLYLVLVLYKTYDPKRFRKNLRIAPKTFDQLVQKIMNNPVFISTGSHAQIPVEEQLAIALYRFGHFGNAAAVEAIAQWAGISAGAVVLCTRRIMQAILALHDKAVHWPSPAEKEAAKEWIEAASCVAWRNGWLLVDGTLVPLAEKPGHHGEAYFDRKSNYSLNVQVSFLLFSIEFIRHILPAHYTAQLTHY